MREARIWKNKTGKVIEFMYGGQPYMFEPGEQKPLDGDVTYHVQHYVNTNLTDVTGEHKKDEPYEKIDKTEGEKEAAKTISWDDLKWKDLVKAGSALGFYKPGMSRRELLIELKK